MFSSLAVYNVSAASSDSEVMQPEGPLSRDLRETLTAQKKKTLKKKKGKKNTKNTRRTKRLKKAKKTFKNTSKKHKKADKKKDGRQKTRKNSDTDKKQSKRRKKQNKRRKKQKNLQKEKTPKEKKNKKKRKIKTGKRKIKKKSPKALTRQATCPPGPDLECINNAGQALKIEKDQVKNFIKQSSRVKSYLKTINAKMGKNTAFSADSANMKIALGGNLDNATCGGSNTR